MHYVYKLIENGSDQLLWIGTTVNTKRRLYQHTRVKPNSKNRFGKFYGKDCRTEIIKSFEIRKEAVRFENEQQEIHGLTKDFDKSSKKNPNRIKALEKWQSSSKSEESRRKMSEAKKQYWIRKKLKLINN